MPRLFRLSRLLPLLLMLAWLAPGAASAGLQVLPPAVESQRAAAPVQVLVEPPGPALSPEQALAPSRADDWQQLPSGHVNLPHVMGPVWVRLSVRNDSARPDWVAVVDWPLLLDARLHVRKTGGAWQLADPASLPPREPGAYFALNLSPGETAELLLRVTPTATAIVPLEFRTQPALWAERRIHTGLMGMLFGVLLVMLAYNACLAWFTADHRYVDYSLYLVSVLLYELAATGYGPALVWDGSPWLISNGYAVFGCLSFLTATWFFRRFLDVATCAPRHIQWANVGFLGFWSVTAVLAAVSPGPALYGAVVLASILSGAVAIYSSVRLGLAGNPAAWMFGAAWALLVVGTAATMLAHGGMLPTEGLAVYGQHLGFVVETVLLSVALAHRIQQARRQSQALSRSLEAERDQKLRAQAETLALQQQANEALEQRVVERTQALERAMQALEDVNAELAELSVTDALTRVHNRRHLDQALAREVLRPSQGIAPIALLLIDIDHFKRINDRFGHIVGDECLRVVAASLRAQVNRAADLVARFGGEEFAVVLPGTDAAQAVQVAERLRRAVKACPVRQGDDQIVLTVSIGVAALAGERHASDWLARADQALYAAKRRGRDQVVYADERAADDEHAPTNPGELQLST